MGSVRWVKQRATGIKDGKRHVDVAAGARREGSAERCNPDFVQVRAGSPYHIDPVEHAWTSHGLYDSGGVDALPPERVHPRDAAAECLEPVLDDPGRTSPATSVRSAEHLDTTLGH